MLPRLTHTTLHRAVMLSSTRPLTARALANTIVNKPTAVKQYNHNNTSTFNNALALRRPFATATQHVTGDQSGKKSIQADVKSYEEETRPISPHVTIYAFPLPALMSITHRFTGIGLTIGTTGFATLALLGSCDIPSYVYAFQTGYPILVPVAKLVVAFPYIYHYAAGMRHMYWDYTGKGVDLDSVYKSAQLIIGSSAFLTLLAAIYTI